MANLKDRYIDQTLRLIRRHLKFEICTVDSIQWHKEPDDDRFNTATVIIRDRAELTKVDYREEVSCLQSFVGNYLGRNWNPREGDIVLVWFYQERRGIILGTLWSWAQYPVCRPSPYDLVDKGGQWIKPERVKVGDDSQLTDFLKYPYPEARKPYCFRWFHGPVTGHTGPGRDWCWMFDYCRLGDAEPDCRNCKTIDSIQRLKNQFFKFYSEETESRKAYPYRAEFHAHCGSYWMFESKERPSSEYASEIYTEGEGYWTVQGAKIENGIEVLKGHIRHSPDGSMEGHSATPETSQEDNVGHRWKVYSPDSTISDSRGPIAAELVNLEKKALVRIYKDGSARMVSANDVTGATGRSEVVVGVDGHCWLWNLVDDASIEFFSGGVATVTSPVEINLNAPVIKQNGVQIHPSAAEGWVE